MRPRSFGVRINNEEKSTQGFTLYSPLWNKKTFLINMAGDVAYKGDLPGNPGGYAREGVF